MIPSEYLAFIPLLIYGIALADLLSQWKRLFNPKDLFIPYLLMTIILTETALYNVFVYAEVINKLGGQTYLNYLAYLLPPFLFMLTTNIFTPDSGSDTEEYFKKHMPVFMTLLALFIASHFLFDFNENPSTIVGRIVAGLLVFAAGIFRKKWLIYVIAGIWAITLFFKAGMIST